MSVCLALDGEVSAWSQVTQVSPGALHGASRVSGGPAGAQRVVERHIEGALQDRIHDACTQLEEDEEEEEEEEEEEGEENQMTAEEGEGLSVPRVLYRELLQQNYTAFSVFWLHLFILTIVCII